MGEGKEIIQHELSPDFGKGEKKNKEKKQPRQSTLRLTGSEGDYLPGIKKERVNLKRLGKLRQAMAKVLGKDITHQPELKGMEKGAMETEERRESE